MLCKNKEIRYCKFEQISGHVWFKDFNFDELISLDMKPEFLPKLIMKDTLIFGEKPYPEYIKDLPDWELPEHKPKFTDQYKAEFDEWLKKF
jgi:hypothetical protein